MSAFISSEQIQKAVQAVPNKVTQVLTAAVMKVAGSLPKIGGNKLFDGIMGPIEYPIYQGVKYDLWVAKEGGIAKVKIALDNGGHPNKLLAVIGVSDFKGAGAASVG